MTNVGHGSTFNVYLPRDQAAAVEVIRPLAAAGPRGDQVVLLVEDEPSVRNIAHVVLQRSGYTVLDAADPDSALQLAAAHPGPIDGAAR
jgi:two-component system, cell cycle sensor histidine kinase and response regulator CckA